VGSAPGFSDALPEQRLIAAKIIAHQRALPGSKEGTGVLAAAGLNEVEHHCLYRTEARAAVAPQVSPVRFAFTRLEHRHPRLVGVQRCPLEQYYPQRIYQRLQLHATAAHPLSQR